MSKSIGNVTVPKDIIDNHNIDTLRWWVAAHTVGSGSISVKPHLIDQSAEGIQKIRKILRYLVGYADQMPKAHEFEITGNKLTPLDVYSLNTLVEFDRRAKQLAADYRFPLYVNNIAEYVFNDLSATYLDMTKDRLYLNVRHESDVILKIFFAHFHTLCKHLWPIAPHLVEEVWSYYDSNKPFYESTFHVPDSFENREFNEAMSVASKLIGLFRTNLKKSTWNYRLQICCDEKSLDQLHVSASKLSIEMDNIRQLTWNLFILFLEIASE